jgi:hypothetical protein
LKKTFLYSLRTAVEVNCKRHLPSNMEKAVCFSRQVTNHLQGNHVLVEILNEKGSKDVTMDKPKL